MKKTAWSLALCIALLLWGCSAPAARAPGRTFPGRGRGNGHRPGLRLRQYAEERALREFCGVRGPGLIPLLRPRLQQHHALHLCPGDRGGLHVLQGRHLRHTSSSCASGGITTNLEACGGTVYGGTWAGLFWSSGATGSRQSPTAA